MSSRFLRLLVAAIVVCVGGFITVASAAAPLGASQRGATHGLTERCAENLLGLTGDAARSVPGSASPQVIAQFALFRGARTAADALPSAANMGRQLAAAGAASYDPSAAVQVGRTSLGTVFASPGTVYAVPATISPVVSSACRAVLGATGVTDYLAFQALVTGSGPGACLVTTARMRAAPSLTLPGAPKPAARPAVVDASCESGAVLAGYAGALAGPLDRASNLALIPDGISQIAYSFAGGTSATVPVKGNVAMPAQPPISTPPQHPTAGALSRWLAALLPTTVTETETAGGSTNVALARPASLVSDTVFEQLFEERVASSLFSAGALSNSSGFGASCSARTHRCVAVTVTTTCRSDDRCRIGRIISRYRYVTAKPPPGTTGPDTQPTAPIVGRTNRFVRRPRKLTLVLSGAPRRAVDVLLSVGCVSKRSSTSEGAPPLQSAVPSREPISLPGPGRSFRACDVGALVISRQRGPVRVTVVRG